MARTFVLGSGFSRSMGLATVAELFDTLFQMEGTFGKGEDDLSREFRQIRSALEFLYPNVDTSKESHAYPPFEEFLSLANVSIDFEERDGSQLGFFGERIWQDYYKAGVKLLTKAIERHSSKIRLNDGSPLRRFAQALQPDDTVVTFNWDTILEKQLTELDVAFSLDPFGDSNIKILKLHGSLSWVLLDGRSTPKNMEYFFTLNEEDRLLCSGDHSVLDTWLPLDRSPYIVTPIAQKRPLDLGFMKRLWVHAFDCLAQSSAIAVIGYSIPNEDYHARALLREGFYTAQKAGLDPSITVINPDESSGMRFFSKIHRNFRFLTRKFDGTEMSTIGKICN